MGFIIDEFSNKRIVERGRIYLENTNQIEFLEQQDGGAAGQFMDFQTDEFGEPMPYIDEPTSADEARNPPTSIDDLLPSNFNL